MTHQTGIKASDDLKQFLATAKDGHVRFMKIGIHNESAELLDQSDVCGTWEEDFDSCLQSTLEDKVPCYLFYRLDTRNSQGYEWLFIAYSPDTAETRPKMLYAGTRTTIKMEFGGGLIKDEYFATTREEVTLDGYRQHLVGLDADAPLTSQEEELKEVNKAHLTAVSAGANRLPGISFPISEDALDALMQLGRKELMYVQLGINIEAETIVLHDTANIELVSEFASKCTLDDPRYHFFVFKHAHEGESLESIVFVYSMPSQTSSVKKKMLYSSSKGTLIAGLEQELKIKIEKKFEMEDGGELTDQFLQDELHPKVEAARAKFTKPKGPGGARGARRLIKPAAE